MTSLYQKLLSTALVKTYFLLVFLVAILPSGYLLGINVKIATFVATFCLMALYLLYQHERRYDKPALLTFAITLLIFLSLLSASLLLATFYGNTEMHHGIDAFKNFFAAVTLVFISYFLFSLKLFSFERFLRAVLLANFIFSLAKIAVATAIHLDLMAFAEVESFIIETLRYDFISLQIVPGLVRLQFINDALTPFLLFYVLMARRLDVRVSSIFQTIFVVISLLSIFLAFTRFIWLIALLAIIIALLTARNYKLLTAFCLAGVLLWSTEFGQEIIQERFLSEGVSQSDEIRSNQIVRLSEEISLYPFFGKGVGSYLADFTRSASTPYSYEVQWLAFALQFGAAGLLVVLFYMLAVIYRLLTPTFDSPALAVSTMYLLWLLSGFTNPYLGSSVGGVIFSLFYLSALHLGQVRKFKASRAALRP